MVASGAHQRGRCPICDPAAPFARLVRVSWLVNAPYFAQRVAYLAHSRPSKQRRAQGIKHVIAATRAAPDNIERTADRVGISGRPQPGEPLRLLRLDGRVNPQRLVLALLVGGELVHANNDALAR